MSFTETFAGKAAEPLATPPIAPVDLAEKRAIAYIAKMPEAVEGENGSGAAFAVARKLVCDFALDPETAKRIFREHYNPRCLPPWSEREIEHKIQDAAEKARIVNPVPDRPRATGVEHEPAPPAASQPRKPRPEIDVSRDFAEVADAMIAALAALEIYQRGGALVDYVRDAGLSPDGIAREGAPRLRLLPAARLRELADTAAGYYRYTADGKLRKMRPPPDVLGIVAARGQWLGIRPLAGVVSYPVLRADGSVLDRSGYDARTGLLAELPEGLRIGQHPTRAQALEAVAELEELVADFPFASDVARAAWLAALLTPLARPAIDGPTPMLLVDANTRGTGKSLLADVIGAVVLGQRLPRRTAPDDEAEWAKAILSIAIAADPIVLVDNVTATLRSAALDAVLTGTAYRGRVLGKNEELSLEVRTAFIATSNNATLSADLVRRSLHCRLVSPEEHPEERTGFRRSLPAEAIVERARYLSAALTVLRAYAVAGRPPVEGRALGSYEAWCSVVRDALLWVGQPDAAASQDELREVADTERSALGDLFVAWAGVYRDRPVTTAELLGDLQDLSDRSPALEALRLAVSVWLDDAVTARRIGYGLRASREKIVNGLVLKSAALDRKNVARWRVVAC